MSHAGEYAAAVERERAAAAVFAALVAGFVDSGVMSIPEALQPHLDEFLAARRDERAAWARSREAMDKRIRQNRAYGPEDFKRIAETYRAAKLEGRSVQRAVGFAFDVTPSRGAHLIKLARDNGYLER